MKNPKITVITSLFNCSQYLEGYFQCIASLKYTNELEILLLHNAPTENETQTIQSYLPLYPFIHYHVIENREGLYTTWNRGIRLAQGEYITIWNVDDLRFPESFYHQGNALDANPEADISYGDFYYMYQYGSISKDIKFNADFANNPKAFSRTHQIGCFPMWRKRVHNKIGYFDEQLRLVSDFDFQLRAVINKCTFVKCKNILGAYLALVPGKLSSNQFLQKKEHNVVYLRYGIYDSLNWIYWKSSLKYDIRCIHSFNNCHLIFKSSKSRFAFLINKTPLFVLSICRQPRNIFSYIKHVVFKN